MITAEESNADYFNYVFNEVNYIDATGLRSHQSGFVAEIITPQSNFPYSSCLIFAIVNSSSLFVTRINDFKDVWKLKNQKLHVFDVKCGGPTISPDGKYVAFTDETTPAIIVHKLDDMALESVQLLQAGGINFIKLCNVV